MKMKISTASSQQIYFANKSLCFTHFY